MSREFLYPKGTVCSMGGTGLNCPSNFSCVDSGVGEFALLEGQEPYYVRAAGREDLNPLFANPEYVTPFDNLTWALLSLFIIWIGVGWTAITYYITDTGGALWEFVMTVIYVIGSW